MSSAGAGGVEGVHGRGDIQALVLAEDPRIINGQAAAIG